MVSATSGAESLLPKLSGPYLGQALPGNRPALFAPGFVSTVLYTRDAAISAAGDEFYFSIFAGGAAHIMVTNLEGDQWREPRELFTSPLYQECEPTLAADGSRLLFLCNGDPSLETAQQGWALQNIWAADRDGSGWGEPYCLPAPVNDSTGMSYYPSLTRTGTLYFTREASDRSTAIYCARYLDHGYREPERLGEGVNSAEHQFNACISPDESYLIFCSMGRDENIGRTDYYISFRQADGRFAPAINMGPVINSESNAVGAPSISPDGRFFFFASNRGGLTPEMERDGFTVEGLQALHNSPQNGSSNIFWIETSLIDLLRDGQVVDDSATPVTYLPTPRHQSELPRLEGDYLGQQPPGDEPELFAPGLVSTGLSTRDVAMTPDGDEFYYCVHAPDFSYSTILLARRENGRWSRPEVAPFATDAAFGYMEPFVSCDGQRFYFISSRPDPDFPDREANSDIWMMRRQGKQWSEPERMPAPINSESPEFFPSFTRDGTIYFTRADATTGRHDIYRSRLVDNVFQPEELLGGEVNGGRSQFNAFIAPDESYLITCAVGIPETMGSIDYYVCFRSADDTWTGPINMGDKVNTAGGREYSPYVTPDGRFFFFMSSRRGETGPDADEPFSLRRQLAAHDRPQNGNSDIYWMKADFIEALRPE